MCEMMGCCAMGDGSAVGRCGGVEVMGEKNACEEG
jgi:hypothetical protein